MASAKDVAAWMVQELKQQGELHQDHAAADIEQRFGDAFVYINDNGNLAIHAIVLAEFKKLTPDVVWMRRERYWRKREPDDEPGRNQSY